MRKHAQRQLNGDSPKAPRRKKKRPFMIVLDVLIVVLILSGVYLLARPHITAYRQDKVMDQLYNLMEEPEVPRESVHTSQMPNSTEVTNATEVSEPEPTGEPEYFDSIWVDRDANAIEGESWETFGEEEASPVVQTEPVNERPRDQYYVPNSVELIPMGKIQIDSINLDLPLLKGAKLVPLRYGAGWYESSSTLGERGRATILGHTMMTNSKRFFSRLPETRVGQQIRIIQKNRELVYQIYDIKFIHNRDLAPYLVAPDVDSEIMLVTCYNRPKWDERNLVFARLVSSTTLQQTNP